MSKLPLKTAGDCGDWLEKAINEMTKDNTSIALGNGRTSIVKAKLQIGKMQMDYAKLKKQGAELGNIGEFLATA